MVVSSADPFSSMYWPSMVQSFIIRPVIRLKKYFVRPIHLQPFNIFSALGKIILFSGDGLKAGHCPSPLAKIKLLFVDLFPSGGKCAFGIRIINVSVFPDKCIPFQAAVFVKIIKLSLNFPNGVFEFLPFGVLIILLSIGSHPSSQLLFRRFLFGAGCSRANNPLSMSGRPPLPPSGRCIPILQMSEKTPEALLSASFSFHFHPCTVSILLLHIVLLVSKIPPLFSWIFSESVYHPV